MYSPAQDGIEKTAQAVRYTEAEPPSDISGYVYCFWELRTDGLLSEDFQLHATPDACVDIMFNEIDTSIAGITALRTTYEVLNLGRNFHYVGIQFLPGVWRGNRDEIAYEYIDAPYSGGLPLIATNNMMAGVDFAGKQAVMSELVRQLANEKIVIANSLTEKILTHLADIHNVADMAAVAGVSPRQLQRALKQSTGFAPHDLLKVLRLQRSFAQPNLSMYADQSHFIRSFRKATGYTPTKYTEKFD
jgi:AraC-like DNA-binding protein